jgi:hypothetical protein
MKNLKLLLILFLFITFPSCVTPIQTQSKVIITNHNNSTFFVDYLFEHDGCKIYRFHDCGNYVYFTNCNGETMTYDSIPRTRNVMKKN